MTRDRSVEAEIGVERCRRGDRDDDEDMPNCDMGDWQTVWVIRRVGDDFVAWDMSWED